MQILLNVHLYALTNEAEQWLTYLNSCFGEVDTHSDLFSRVNVGVVGLLEGPFQFLFERNGVNS